MLNRFSSAVSGAVSGAVQNLYVGDEISKNYEMPKDSTASGGHDMLWKIYPAISKKTNVEMSIFIFDKDLIKKMSKPLQERILSIMRNDMKTLRLLRHPNVLKVEEVFEETRRSLAFVTEKVTCSLANANKNFTNVGQVQPEVLEIGLTEFELACGLMNLGNALGFLHREGRRVHMGIGPQSVFITPKGDWKLGGFGFCRTVEPGQTTLSEYYSGDAEPSSAKGGKDSTSYKYRFEPPLEYCAPEITAQPRQFNSSADMFSVGLLVYELFKSTNSDGTRDPVLDCRDGNPMNHGFKIQSLHPINFPPSVPVSLHNTIRSLLSTNPSQRPEARAFLSSPFFDSGPVKTLRNLQSLVEQDPSQQAKFLTQMPELMEGFSTRVIRDMVVPGIQQAIRNPQVGPFAITPLMATVEKLDKYAFASHLAPILAPLLQMKEPVQCMLMFAQKLEVLIPKANDAFIRDHVVPMLCNALDTSIPEILDTVLNKIVDQANLFEYRILKENILPKVITLILQPPQMSVRVNALVWMGKSYHVFDRDVLIEKVLPALNQCLTVDKTPAVCMCLIGCYDSLGKHLGAELTAKSILPSIVPLLFEKTLNGQQFDMVVSKIQSMLKDAIEEREKMFMSENSVKTVASSVDRSMGLSSAVRAAEEKKLQSSGMEKVNKFLTEEPNVAKDSSKSQNRERDSSHNDRRSSNSTSQDPFYLGSSSSSSSSRDRHRSESSHRENSKEDEYDEESNYAQRRRAKRTSKRTSKKKTGSASSNTTSEDLLDIPVSTSNSQGSSSMNVASNMFAGMSMNTAPPVPSSYTAGPASGSGSGPMSMGMSSNSNGGMMSMSTALTPGNSFGQMSSYPQQQSMPQSNLGNINNNGMGMNASLGMNSNGMGMGMNSNNGMGMGMNNNMNTMAQPSQFPPPNSNSMHGPGQYLQIQAQGYHNNQPPQSNSDKFSAFDGL